MSSTYYVLLARHGRHSQHVLTRTEPEKEDSPYPSEIVGDVLREHLQWLPPLPEQICSRIVLAAAFYAPSPEARMTMVLLGRALGSITPDHPHAGGTHVMLIDGREPFVASEDHDLEAGRALTGEGQPDLVKRVREAATNPNTSDGNAVLIVGHQPQLSRLADELARDRNCAGHRRWRRLRLPIAPGEVACLVFAEPYGRWPGHRPPRLLWTVAPADKEAMTDLRDKIKSKMDTAKLLGAAIIFVLGAVLALLTNKDRWMELGEWGQLFVQIAAVLLLASFVLYLATMYAYDRLTMPPRFWTELGVRRSRSFRRGRSLVRRPPSSAVWVLYQNMQRVWWGLFAPATFGFAAALALMSIVFLRGHEHFAPVLVAVVGCGALVVSGLCYWFRPVLGSED